MSARLEPLNREDLPELNPIFERYDVNMGFVPNSVLTMARRPHLVDAHAFMIGSALFGDKGTVPIQLKECIAEICSQTRGCMYCQAHFASNALRYGVQANKVKNIWDFQNSDLFTDAERSALNFAMATAQLPNGVTDEHFIEMRKYWDEAEIVEITMACAVVAYLNTWNDSMGTPLEEAPSDVAEEHLGATNWHRGKHARS